MGVEQLSVFEYSNQVFVSAKGQSSAHLYQSFKGAHDAAYIGAMLSSQTHGSAHYWTMGVGISDDDMVPLTVDDCSGVIPSYATPETFTPTVW